MIDERIYFEKFRKGGDSDFILLDHWVCLDDEDEKGDLGDYDLLMYDGDLE